MQNNYFKGTFLTKTGKKVIKEFTSTSKNSTQLRKEAIDKQKEKGMKYLSGCLGTKFR